MPELRRDPVAGYWTIFSTERGWRPVEYKQRVKPEERACPFCEGAEAQTPHETYAIRREDTEPNTPGWSVRAVLSRHPLLSDGHATVHRYGVGLYDVMDAVGQHEIVIETPKHNVDLDEFSLTEIENVIRVYVQRFGDLEHDNRFKYAILFKNHGQISGSARDIVRHARAQIIAMPIAPKRLKEELEAAKRYYDYHNRCVSCDMLQQELKERGRIVCEYDGFVAFCPFASRQPFEIWILPKKHSADFGKLDPDQVAGLARALKESLVKVKTLLQDPPYNLILHTAPFRHRKLETYWKTVTMDYHWYLQISPRLTQNAGFEWGSGIYINATAPEEAARLLREIPADLGG